MKHLKLHIGTSPELDTNVLPAKSLLPIAIALLGLALVPQAIGQVQSTASDPWGATPSSQSGAGYVPTAPIPAQPIPLVRPMAEPSSVAAQKNAQLPTVSIREFRTSVPEISVRGAMDMFMTELIRSRKFRVVERARLAEGAAAEKDLNLQGLTTGQTGATKYLAAAYMFEATISEATTGESQRGFGLNIMGAGVDRTTTSDTIAIDLRLIDVESGVAVDAQSARKSINTSVTKGGGLINAVAAFTLSGQAQQIAQALPPIDQAVSARKDSVDKALREAIEEAIGEIAKRLQVNTQ